MKRTSREAAERIIAGYREVCTMMPHAPCVPEDSSDNAVILAVEYFKEHPPDVMGPISLERFTLDELIAELEKRYWRRVENASKAAVKKAEKLAPGLKELVESL